jgi:hypothetical protein
MKSSGMKGVPLEETRRRGDKETRRRGDKENSGQAIRSPCLLFSLSPLLLVCWNGRRR